MTLQSHLLFCLKSSVKIPSALPVTNPVIKSIGAMYLAFWPKRMKRATKSWARLFASAPERLIPTELIFERKIEFARIIINAEEKEPAAENRKMYEKSVPEITPWAITLKKTTRAISCFFKVERERITGRFASPSLRNGSGFGIAYSTAERKRQSAEKKVISFVLYDFSS